MTSTSVQAAAPQPEQICSWLRAHIPAIQLRRWIVSDQPLHIQCTDGHIQAEKCHPRLGFLVAFKIVTDRATSIAVVPGEQLL